MYAHAINQIKAEYQGYPMKIVSEIENVFYELLVL